MIVNSARELSCCFRLARESHIRCQRFEDDSFFSGGENFYKPSLRLVDIER